jgi:hypothetical protein
MNFKREDRYFVFKRSDLLPHQAKGLDDLRATANKIRGIRGKPPLECVVVESDWPEYETVWDMIQGRVEGEQAECIHREMVEYNNKLAAQADAAESFAAGEGYYDGFQLMAFAMFGLHEED